MSSSTSTLPGIQIPNMKKIEMDVLDNRRFAGFLQAVFSTFLGTQPFPAHILPCLEELAKELQTKRHSTQLNNKSTTVPVCQSMQIKSLIAHRSICQVVCVRYHQGHSLNINALQNISNLYQHLLLFSRSWL